MHYLFRVICFEYRIVTVEYFMDVMQYSEVVDIIKNIRWLDKNEKEIDHYKLYVTVQANSKKKVKLEEVMKLPWDDENKNLGTIMTEDEKKEAMKKAKEIEERMKHMTFGESIDMEDMYKNTHMKQNG